MKLPEVGTKLEKGGEAAVVESVKTASDIFAPVAGEVIEVNEAVAEDPAIVNSDPQSAGWIFKLKVADLKPLDELMDETAYKKLIG